MGALTYVYKLVFEPEFRHIWVHLLASKYVLILILAFICPIKATAQMDSDDDFLGDVSSLYNDTIDLDADSEIHYGPLVLTAAPKVRASLQASQIRCFYLCAGRARYGASHS